MTYKSLLPIVFTFLIIISCSDDGPVNPGVNPEMTSDKPNILFIIADDMGIDATPGYNIGDQKPDMPHLEQMITDGIRFNNLWSYASCTPTRSSIITGKYGFRTGVTQVGDILSTSEISLQRYMDNNDSQYSHAVIGKWHLSQDPSHPTDMGIDYYAGLLDGGVQSYTRWDFTENQSTSQSREYSTSKFTDLAIDWIDEQDAPWFLWLAYNAPHTPFHLPPADLHNRDNLPEDQASIDSNPLPYYFAMLEAMDTEIGRLLESMTAEEKENTIIIFIGDNGTSGQVIQEYNSRRGKGSVYQGGVNVPMVISGKGVSRNNSSEDALINTTDLFSTIADIAGIPNSDINDSQSIKPLLTGMSNNNRDVIYTELGDPNSDLDVAIRNDTHKYLLFSNGIEALYNLSDNPLEAPNLLSANQLPLSNSDSEILDDLLKKLDEIR